MNTLLPSVAALLAFGSTGVALAHGDVRCEVPKAERKPQMELQAKLVAEGWRVRKVQLDNGCYEVYGFDDKGERVEAWFHPATFERVLPSGR